MPRAKIELPKHVNFSTEIKIRISDINYGGHVGNEAIIALMQEARIQYIQSLGFESEVKIVDPVGIIVADCIVIYKSESFYGESVEVSISCDEFSKYGFNMYYKISSTKDGREVAKGKNGIVFFDYSIKKLAETPPKFIELSSRSNK